MVTSSLENEGKSSVAVNLALVLAKNNHKVLLIDGDLRKSSLHLIFDIEGQTIGIHDVLNHKAQLSDAIQTLDNYKIDVLFGNDSSEATYDTASNEMKNIIKTVKQEYDYVIVDTAPSRFLSDSRILAADMDGIILVVRQNFAKVSLINDTIEKLDLSNTPIIGTIINRSYSSKVTRNHEEYGYNNKRHNVSRRREE